LSKHFILVIIKFMKIDYAKLAELREGETPYKGYSIPLERGFIRIMSSKLDKDGMVVAINYYGKIDEKAGKVELNRVTDKRQPVKEFEDDLARFKEMLEKSGLSIFIEEL
jgi:hypothetical protein